MNIHVRSGDAYAKSGSNDRRIGFTVTKDGDRVDLTGVALKLMVKRSRFDDDDDAVIEKDSPTEIEIASPQTGDTKGVCYLTLESDDTEDEAGRFYWELEATDSVGKVTLMAGGFYVKPDLIVV